MSHYRTSLLLPAPVERVWAAYTDAAHVNQWLPGAGSGLCASRPLAREGARYALRFSRWHRSSIQVVAVDTPRLHQRRFRDIFGHLRGTVTTQFEPLDGAARVTFDLNYTFAPLWLDGALDRLFGGGIRQQAERELERFQQYVESLGKPSTLVVPPPRRTITLTVAVVAPA